MFSKIKRLARHSIIQGGVVFSLSQYIAAFFNYLFNSLSAKTLGPAGYSEIVTLFSYLVMFSFPLTIINTLIIRSLGNSVDKKSEKANAWEALFVQKVIANKYLIIGSVGILLGFLVPVTNLSIHANITLVLMLFGAFASAFYMSLLQGLHNFTRFAFATVVQAALKCAGPILLLFGVFGNIPLYLTLVASAFVPVVASAPLFHNKRSTTTNDTKPLRLKTVLFRPQTIIAACSLAGMSILGNIDVALVKKFYPAHIAGLYGAWSLFAKIILYVLAPFLNFSFILFADNAYKKKQKMLFIFSMILFVCIGFSLFLLYKTFGDSIVLLFFNAEYRSIVVHLPLAALFGVLYSLIFFINNFFLSRYSKVSLVIFFAVPLYIWAIATFNTDIQHVMLANIGVSAILVGVYGCFLVAKYVFKKPHSSIS